MAVRARAEVTLTRIEVDEETHWHFWHDEEGAHVTEGERPADGEAITGKNVLLTGDGLQVRDGSTVLARFEDDTAELGINSTNSKVIFSGGTSYVGYVGHASSDGSAVFHAPSCGSSIVQVGETNVDPYRNAVAAIGVNVTGDMETDTGMYQIGDGSARPRAFIAAERLYLLGANRMSDRADVAMNDVISVLENGPYVKSMSAPFTRLYVGSKILTLSSSFQRLFTDAEYRAIVGRSFSQNDDVVLVMNGDLGAADVRPYGTSYVPSEKAVYFNCAAGTGGASRWSWVIVRRA